MTQSIQRPEWADPKSPAAQAAGNEEELVLELMQALSSNNADQLIGYFADEAMYQNMPLPPAYGRDQVHATLTGLFQVLRIDRIDTFHIASRAASCSPSVSTCSPHSQPVGHSNSRCSVYCT